MRKIVVSYILFFCAINLLAQIPANVKINDKAPNFILPSYNNTVENYSFPIKKNVVYLYFWNSQEEKSKENFYKYKRIYKNHVKEKFKNGDGFDMIFIALQSDKTSWEADIKSYNLTRIKNVIAVKAYDDYFVKQYSVKNVPQGFVIDELGKVVSINPDIEELQAVLNTKLSTPKKIKNIKDISGKISQPLQENKKYIGNEKIYVTNTNKDTIQTITTSALGTFTISNVGEQDKITLLMSNSPEINNEEILLLENEEGDEISDFDHQPSGYSCTISKTDMGDMKTPVKEIAEFYYSENLFTSGGTELNSEAKQKLSILIETLQQNPKLKIDIITHTDCKGDAVFNEKLSLKRANVCANYFVKNGITKTRIVTIGKGESMPINNCTDGVNCTDKELEVNRRTEFKFYIAQ